MSKIDEAILEYNKKDYEKSYVLFKEIRGNEIEEEVFDKFYSYKFVKIIYEKKLRHLETIDKEAKKDIIYILSHLTPKDIYYKLTVFKTIELIENEENTKWENILVWIKKLDINYLSDQKNSFEMNGKRIETFSELEKYYLKLTKAYEKMKDYENLYITSREGLNKIKEFTNNTDIWLKRRLAICCYQRQEYQEAINLYKEILLIKKDWYLYREIGRIYQKVGNKKEIILNYLESFTRVNDVTKISNLLNEVYNLFEDDNIEIKKKLYILHLALKSQKNINLNDQEEKEKLNLNINEEDIKEVVPEKYFIKLKRDIKDLKLSYQERKIGVVKTLKEKFCFIECNGESYFCKIEEFPKKVIPEKGMNVEFSIVESFDKKKNKASFQGKDIKILGGNY